MPHSRRSGTSARWTLFVQISNSHNTVSGQCTRSNENTGSVGMRHPLKMDPLCMPITRMTGHSDWTWYAVADHRPVAFRRPQAMKRNPRRKQLSRPKSILKSPDLEAAKSAVLNSLSCPDAQRGYRHAIDEFVEWYCSEPRLSFSKTVVLWY